MIFSSRSTDFNNDTMNSTVYKSFDASRVGPQTRTEPGASEEPGREGANEELVRTNDERATHRDGARSQPGDGRV